MTNGTQSVPSELIPNLASIDLALLVTLFDQAADIAFFVKDVSGRYDAVNDSLLNRHGLKKKFKR